ncbi:hypothetical protein PMAYCL1PPCAC_10376, partial [Pristionchus mayeri]
MNSTSAGQIVEKVGGTYKLNSDALKRILQQKSVLNKKVAILTVAGAFRKGKSFLLSNIVRYLLCERDGTDWMDSSALVTGFTWARSKDAVTDGILMWPEPFFAEDANGEEFAILLMDTEGVFDHKSSMGQCATVFALAALLSSVLVYNVMQDVQEDTLNHLQFFAKYGSFAEDSNSPFQQVLFLIRDWQNDDEFGFEAGRKLLDDKFKKHASTDSSMQTLRKDIQRSFTDMKCALLSSPSDKICRGSEGQITVDDMNDDFKDELGELVPRVFNTLLHPKENGGKTITGAEFLSFFETYAKIFASGKVPEPKSIFEATAEATHQSALNTSLENYTKAMRTHFFQLADRKFFEEAKLQSIHQEATSASVKMFTDIKKMGNLPQFVISLKQKIEEQFREVYRKDNQSRISVEKARKEKEEAERRRIEQEKRAKEEQEAGTREGSTENTDGEREEREGRSGTQKNGGSKTHKERMEREMRERKEAERRMLEEQRREREIQRGREKDEAERARREREEETERVRRQMEQMRLESERREREREEERREKEREAEQKLQRERRRREEAEAEAAMRMFMQPSFMQPSFMGRNGRNEG